MLKYSVSEYSRGHSVETFSPGIAGLTFYFHVLNDSCGSHKASDKLMVNVLKFHAPKLLTKCH